jgi:hypothetical protein
VTHALAALSIRLRERNVRYVLIGVAGANLYAPAGQAVFLTEDFDLFLPSDPDNLVRAWEACNDCGLEMWLGNEALDPRDRWLASRVVERRALTRATGPEDFQVDLTLVMKAFEFEEVWNASRLFHVEGGVGVPTARLLHIVRSKQAADRDKDNLFLAAHRDALEQLLKNEES